MQKFSFFQFYVVFAVENIYYQLTAVTEAFYQDNYMLLFLAWVLSISIIMDL